MGTPQSHFARAREIIQECLDAYPDFLIGHAAHTPFKEWNNKCARGRVVGIDKDHSGNTLWQIRYEADDKASFKQRLHGFGGCVDWSVKLQASLFRLVAIVN